MKMNFEGKKGRGKSRKDGWIRLRIHWERVVDVCVGDVENRDK